MVIGVDIDDTITNTIDVLKKVINLYGKDLIQKDSIKKEEEDFLSGKLSDEIIIKFFIKYGERIGNEATIKEGAKEVLDRLHNEGYKIVIITARSDKSFKNAYEFCKNYLERNNIYFDKLITSQSNKLEACIKENVSLMIDDSIRNCEMLKSNNIRTVLFTSENNKKEKTTCDRVNNWNELYEYINKIKIM